MLTLGRISCPSFRSLLLALLLLNDLPEALGQCSGSSVYLDRFVRPEPILPGCSGNQKWPGGLVPFQLDGGLSDDQRSVILDAMTYIMTSLADIKFLPRLNNQTNFLHVRYKDVGGCGNSCTGMQPEGQYVNVDCVNRWTVIHELLHALGFPHEQSRPDRDIYVEILLGNVESTHEHNFDKREDWLLNSTNTPYDFRSVMHYGECAFSTCLLCGLPLFDDRGCWTIDCRDGYGQYQDEMGNRSGWGDYDVQDLQNVYGWYPNYLIDWHNVTQIPGDGTLECPWDWSHLDEAVLDIKNGTDGRHSPATIWMWGGGSYAVNQARSRLSAPVTLKVIPGSGPVTIYNALD